MLGGNGSYAYAAIGNGGLRLNGSVSGATIVNATGTSDTDGLRILGGEGSYSSATVGHLSQGYDGNHSVAPLDGAVTDDGTPFMDDDWVDQGERGLQAVLAGPTPLDAAVLNNFANSLAQRGEDLDRAAELIEQALKLQPDKAEYLSTKGWVLYKKKDYSAAREVFERALSQGGDEDPLILEHFGDLLYQLQETDQALLYWQQAQEKGSDAPLLEKKIANKQLYE